MKPEITSAARPTVAGIFGIALLGMISALPVHTSALPMHNEDFESTSGSMLTFESSVKVQNEGVPSRGAERERHDYTKDNVPGAIGSKRQKLNAGSSARAGQYTYTRVDVPGAVFTGLFAINSKGQTVGLYQDASDTAHGFLRNVDGSIITIDYPGATFLTANGINSQGDAVGRWDDASGITHSFLRTSQGAITSFDPPAPCVATILPSAAHGINDLGDIVGRCFDASNKELGWLLRQDGRFVILDHPGSLTTDAWAIDNSRVVVGDYSGSDEFVHGYVWTESGEFTTLDFENNLTGLRAINNRGDISGIYFNGLTLLGFLRTKNGTDFTIAPPGSVETDSAVVNISGTVAGLYFDADFNGHGYIAIPSAIAARVNNEKLELVRVSKHQSAP